MMETDGKRTPKAAGGERIESVGLRSDSLLIRDRVSADGVFNLARNVRHDDRRVGGAKAAGDRTAMMQLNGAGVGEGSGRRSQATLQRLNDGWRTVQGRWGRGSSEGAGSKGEFDRASKETTGCRKDGRR